MHPSVETRTVTDTQRPTRVRWGVFSLTFSTSALLYLHRYAFSFIKPSLMEEWGLNKTELGLLDSAFFTAYTVFQFPLGIAADAFGVHLILTLLLVVWSAGLALLAWSPSLFVLKSGQWVFGLGQSAVYACLSRAARNWFPPDIRTTLQGAVGVLAGRLGALGTAIVFGSLLMGTWGLDWRTATWVFVGTAVVQTLVFAAFFRNSPREHPLANEAEVRLIEGDEHLAAAPPRMTLREMLRSTSPRSFGNLLVFSGQCILSTFADVIYSSWIPLFLWEVHHLEYKAMGFFSGLPLLGGALAGLLGGMLNDFCIARLGNRRWARSGVALIGKGMAAALLFSALLFYERPYIFCGMLFFVKLFGDWSLASTWGVVADIGGRGTASVYAFTNTLAGIASISAPAVYGAIAQHLGWPAVFVTAATTYVLCAASWLFIDCTIPVLRPEAAPVANSAVT